MECPVLRCGPRTPRGHGHSEDAFEKPGPRPTGPASGWAASPRPRLPLPWAADQPGAEPARCTPRYPTPEEREARCGLCSLAWLKPSDFFFHFLKMKHSCSVASLTERFHAATSSGPGVPAERSSLAGGPAAALQPGRGGQGLGGARSPAPPAPLQPYQASGTQP